MDPWLWLMLVLCALSIALSIAGFVQGVRRVNKEVKELNEIRERLSAEVLSASLLVAEKKPKDEEAHKLVIKAASRLNGPRGNHTFEERRAWLEGGFEASKQARERACSLS